MRKTGGRPASEALASVHCSLLAAAALVVSLSLIAEIAANSLQSSNALYRSLPSWAWFVGMGAWGAALGLALAREGA